MRPEINFEAESFAGYNPSEGEEPEQFAKSWGGGAGAVAAGVTGVGEVEAGHVGDRASGDHVGHIVGDIDAGRGCTEVDLDSASAIPCRMGSRLPGRRAACRR